MMLVGVVLLLTGVWNSLACAEPPATINIRGQLLDAEGHALPGVRDFSVQFYDSASGGAPLGAAILGQVEVEIEGLFNIPVVLPPQVLLSPQTWYEVAVASSPLPDALTGADVFPNRVKVESVPFALESQQAAHVEVSAIGSGSILDAEFGYLSGLTGSIQTQLDRKANSADVAASQAAQDSSIAAKANATDVVAKAGDTMTGALNVNNGYVGIGQAAVPSPPTDKLYNVDGTLSWNGNPAYRFPWTAVTTNTQMGGNHGYIANGASLVTLILPASASLTVGDTVRASGLGAGGWKIAQNASQTILTGPMQIPDYSGAWTPRESNRWWHGVDSSVDGCKLVACDNSLGRLYTSTDSGVTWTARESNRNWTAVASSADGSKLVATVQNGQIYTSTDSGATWTPRGSSRSWTKVTSSANGNKLVATVYGGQIYTSSDSGVTWTPRETNRSWAGVATSADGSKLVVAVENGRIYTSTDSGVTWTPRESDRGWWGVASSADGTKLAAGAYNGQIYTSTDSGVTWTPRESNRTWQAVASSSDGSKLVACVSDGQIYTSTDSGVTWTPWESNRLWWGVASSADGFKLAACVDGGQIYTLNTLGATVAQTPAGISGYLAGAADSAIELQYEGNDTFRVLSHETPHPYPAPTRPELDALLAARADATNVYTKAEVDALQSAQDSAIAGKVAKVGDTMTGALVMNSVPLSVTNSYLGLGQSTAPGTVTDKLYNAGGTLQWSGQPVYRFPWTTVSADTSMAGNNGYIVDSTTLLTLTLPPSSSLTIGDTVRVNGMGSGGWKVAQNASQSILTGSLQIPDYSGAWTARDSLRTWMDVASSADGAKLVACELWGYLYTSTDSGATWTARDGDRYWQCVASSADGTKLVACTDRDVYTSTDSGVTWTQHYDVFGSRYPARVASSADGTKLVACTINGPIYTSTDSGTTWTARASNRAWNWVDSSTDGTKLVACEGRYSNGNIYTSTDSGATWTPHGPSLQWWSVASSSDGTKLVACVLGGRIYTSIDSGATWTPRGSSQRWYGVASSADGTKLVACVDNGAIYISTDSGAIWVPNASTYPHPGLWTDAASSADGTKLVACGAWGTGGQIYTYSYLGEMIAPSTTVGTDGFIMGGLNTAAELQYLGNGTFCPLSHEGFLSGN
jgi:photosystem II stability/assembly factor-like uncharacterized protein